MGFNPRRAWRQRIVGGYRTSGPPERTLHLPSRGRLADLPRPDHDLDDGRLRPQGGHDVTDDGTSEQHHKYSVIE
jgi:hypothetical protein